MGSMATPLPSASASLRRAVAPALALALAAWSAFLPARAAADPKVAFDLPLDRAEQSLKVFSAQSGQQVLFTTETVAQVRTNAVRGEYTPREALDRMLRGTGLAAEQDQPAGAWRIRRAAAPPASDPPAPARPALTGTANTGASGAITGVVSNAATGAYLEGAEVALAGSPLRTLTGRDGGFAFPVVPAGPQILRVRYSGLDGLEQAVEVAAGRSTHVVVSLSSDVYQLQAFTVSAEREGNAASITRQRNAGNIINVVSLDAYGDVADGNLGNFMQKLPGVATHNAEGDIVGVMLRGAPPGMSAVSLDGTQLTSASASNTGTLGDRAAVIDRVPAEFIKEIEVTKASTPDMDATGLGGAAKLITKSGFDFKTPSLISFRGGLSQNTYRDNPWTFNSSLTAMRKFGTGERFAVTFSGSYTDTVVTRDRVQMTMAEAFLLTSGLRLLNDTYTRNRSGAGLKLEFRPTPATRLYVDALWSRYASDTERYDYQISDAGGRRTADYARVSRAAIEAGTVPLNTAGQRAGLAPGWTGDNVELLHATLANRVASDWRRDGQTMLAAGGATKLGAGEITVRATYAEQDYHRAFEEWQGSLPNLGFTIDQRTARSRPVLRQSYGPALTAFTGYTAQFRKSLLETSDEIATVAVDAKHPWSTGGMTAVLQAGLKYQSQYRWTDPYAPTWIYVGADRVAGRNAATGLNDDNVAAIARATPGYGLFNGFYPRLPAFNLAAAQTLLATQPAHFTPSGTTVSNDTPSSAATEEVVAGYAMGTATLGALTTVAGVRAEQTDVEARGVQTRAGVFSPTRRAGDYRKYFPSAHLRYRFTDRLIARASYSTTMARPTLGQIIPTTTVTATTGGLGLGTVNQNNTDLGPQYSKNYDLMLEWYFRPVGVLSAGVFRKQISGFIATSRGLIGSGTDNGFGGEYAGYDLVTQQNVASARIEGYELNYDQQLRQLPAPFNTLAVFANYTHTRTTGTYDAGAGELANFVPTTWNVGLSYAFRRLQLRVAYNRTSAYLITYNATPRNATRQTASGNLGVNLTAKVTPWLNASVDVFNLLNDWPDNYSVEPNRITVSEVYGTRVTFALSGRF